MDSSYSSAQNTPQKRRAEDLAPQIRDLIARKLSFRLAAAELGVSRSAMSGMAYRLGLSFGGAPPRTGQKSAKKPSQPLYTPKEKALDYDQSRAPGLPLMDLRAHQCKWPVNDPKHGDFYFCGADKKLGAVYCRHHHSRSRRAA